MKSKALQNILWILFCFAIIEAVKAIFSFIIYTYFHIALELEIFTLYIISTILVLCLFLFDFTAVFVLNYLNQESFKLVKLNQKPPLRLFVITLVIAVFLNPITKALDSWHIESLFSIVANDEYMSIINLVEVYSIMNLAIELCFWSVFIFLFVYFWYYLRKENY
jgi:hypothetical protein